MNNQEQIEYLEAVENPPTPKNPTKAAFVCGIVSMSLIGLDILLFFFAFMLGIILAFVPTILIIAIIINAIIVFCLRLAIAILAIIGLSNGIKALKLPEGKKSQKILAVVFSSIALLWAAIYFICWGIRMLLVIAAIVCVVLFICGIILSFLFSVALYA